ncbi:NADPH-dependent 7-cyano-7-deazaguanine reductase QueF [Coralloluteibacterium stylophorae]|uniref:NADPH-dependent 7-cyano-7-deazaguanine reductase n=1 Tax=Coralloluteibacterium stylophorae TaxID=1776034 RepID=A0A8J7VSD0_9GAMM|nr:NADPH-dependent 7-cyano-7-deazaguanine reductase QueF [Coralloluteibacterium stylophorae]MBS7458126.1 NADPH-dependent 7-cyano-7-deazaguanine reductase QueF [Coralloluteibacterium stylophorae]
MSSPHDSGLGRATAYPTRYDPSLLFPIPRAEGRAALDRGVLAGMRGVDIWNAYELSWRTPRGRPVVAMAEFRVPADSSHLIESKSFKLYLNSLNAHAFDGEEAVRETLARDLSAAAGGAVEVTLVPASRFGALALAEPEGESIDDQDIDIDHYAPPRPEFLAADADDVVEETLVSHLLKSNCPVTGQPDWASVQVRYAGPRIDRAGLLRYVVSFREHCDFHEQCVERMYADLHARCAPTRLSVFARYTRRGGLDINPWRSSGDARPPNPRGARQ